jgi:deoxycytidylate deaminase
MSDSANSPLPRTQSSVLVIGIAGRIGSGASFVRDKILQCLRSYDYCVDIVDVTVIMEKFEGQLDKEVIDEIEQDLMACTETGDNGRAKRVRRLQLLGNALRRTFGNQILAALTVTEFIGPDLDIQSQPKLNERKAYVIDSLKHPDEVRLLKQIFGSQFWMLGVVSSDMTRSNRLEQRKGFPKQVFDFLSREDADGEDARDLSGRLGSGQQTVKAVLRADYFFANDFATKEEIEADAGRLSRLMFGIQVVSPTEDEVGMNAASQASLRSACLSRQVGASILSESGELLGTGHNDVPKFGGGLYGATSNSADRRCWAWGAKCYNDEEKMKITHQVVELLANKGFVEKGKVNDAVDVLRKSRISGLIEFSRAVHAEMEAMLSIARLGTTGLVGSTLYTTTYPCHNCAKHIVDAGIKRVVYLEPYEKSLARLLHPDAISDPLQERNSNKVCFDNYGGVSPRRFGELFHPNVERKKNGLFQDLDRNRHDLKPILCEESETLKGRLSTLQEWIDGNSPLPVKDL